MPSLLTHSNLVSLRKLHQGKVRDIYEVDDNHILICTTDRVSAFDVILPNGIPEKGIILTDIANFWFSKTKHIVPNHLSEYTLESLNLPDDEYQQLLGRSIIVKKQQALPIEAIVRGYLLGSGWKDYQKTGTVCGISLPKDLRLADRLEQPLFTPSTKAMVGDHDINISFAEMCQQLDTPLAEKIQQVSLQLYQFAADFALQRNVIIADTKFEFGLDENGELILIDEILTPDSSRFWEKEHYRPTISPPSFDKQIIRDYLSNLAWNKKPPAPVLPDDIIEKTQQQYQEVKRRLLT
ncbi:MAG: phosphoribosylaminoimidazolesuccinocarboxamide synthase [bacterium]